MVDAIEKVLNDSWSWKSGDRFLANKLLEVIESKGMLPPPYKKVIKIAAHPREKSIITVNEWELENE